jgi:hypothetical protein
MLTPC